MTWPIVRRAAAGAALVAAGLVVIAAELSMESPVTSPRLALLQRGAEVGLLAAAVALAAVPRPWLTAVAAAAAMATSGLALVGRPGRMEAASLIATAIVMPLVLVLAALLVVRWRRPLGAVVIVLIVVLAVVAVVRALVYDQFADLHCPGLCRRNPFGVPPNLDLARVLGRVGAAIATVLGAAIASEAIRALRRSGSGGIGRRLAPGAAAIGAVVVAVDSAGRLVTGTIEVPGHASAAGFGASLVASVLVAAGLVLTAADPLRARRDVGRVAALLARADPTTDPESALRAGFGDPTLRVGYWVDGVGFVDRDEKLVTPSGGGRIELTSREEPIALIALNREAVTPQLVSRELGAHARLAIHNESLTRALRRSIADVARSRRRLVELGDAERRRLERDLHDGAQQRLLALSFELRRGERTAAAAGDHDAERAFVAGSDLARSALEQLRQLAHGIHPAELDGGGLRDALSQLTSSLEGAGSIDVDVPTPITGSLAATIYRVVAAVAADDGSRSLRVEVTDRGSSILLSLGGVAALPEHAVDRVAAAGGAVCNSENGIEVTLPCAP